MLFAGIDLSAQIERSDSPQAMRSQIFSSITRVRIEGRPGRRFVACIAVAIVTADRLPGKAIKRRFARVRTCADRLVFAMECYLLAILNARRR